MVHSAVTVSGSANHAADEKYQALIGQLAKRIIGRQQGRKLDLNELVSAGNEALCASALEYDPAKGATFWTFARNRVLGAMLDLTRRKPLREASHVRLADIPDPVAIPTMESSIDYGRLMVQLRDAIEGMNDRHRLIIQRHYVDGARFVDIAAEMHVCDSRVYQLHAQAMSRLRRHFRCRAN